MDGCGSLVPKGNLDGPGRTWTDPDGPDGLGRTRTDPDGPGRIKPIIDTYDVRTRTDPDGPGRAGRTRTNPDGPGRARTGPDGPDGPDGPTPIHRHMPRPYNHWFHFHRNLLQDIWDVFSLGHFDLYGHYHP